MMKTIFQRILTSAALCLAAMGGRSLAKHTCFYQNEDT